MNISNISVWLALLAGILTVFSPCILPILPIIIGRSLNSHPWGPIALVSGLITGFAVTGSLLGITASWFIGLSSSLHKFAIVLLLCLGILSIFPKLSYRLFSYIQIDHRLEKIIPIGLMGEFCLGTQLGLVWTPCAGPILASILVLAASNQAMISAFILLIIYGIGAALPMLAIAYGSRFFSQQILNLRSHTVMLQRIGGVMVSLTAIAILSGWDVQLQLWLLSILSN